MNQFTSAEADVAIIGAGPYGLSLGAQLTHKGVSCEVFGKPMQSWSEHMPANMRLKSEGFASTLYDGRSGFTLAKFCAERAIPYSDIGWPVPVETFIDYGLAFQKACVPGLHQTMVTSVARKNGKFSITYGHGSRMTARKVVIATGISHLEHVPPVLARVGRPTVTHSADHVRFAEFAGRSVAVVGGGASAMDVAAALGAEGANVQVITRQPEVHFHSRQSRPSRSIWEKLRAPMTGLGPGWKSYLCAECPLVFHKMPSEFRSKVVRKHLGPAAGWFVRDQIVGKVPMHLRSNITAADSHGRQVRLRLEGVEGTRFLDFDHVIAATGYRTDLRRLSFLDADLHARIQAVDGCPALNSNFGCSIDGLYFVGPPSAGWFGPLMRFAFGAKFATRRLTRHLSRRSA